MVLGIFSRKKGSVVGVIVSGIGVSEDEQRRRIQERAEAEGLRVDKWVTVDPGSVPDAGKGDTVIVYTFKGMGRSPSDAARVYEELQKRGAKVIQAVTGGPSQPSMGC